MSDGTVSTGRSGLHMFRELLHAELMEREPVMVPELHRRAAAWYEAHDLLEVAIEHAQEAGDVDLVARQVFDASFGAWAGGPPEHELAALPSWHYPRPGHRFDPTRHHHVEVDHPKRLVGNGPQRHLFPVARRHQPDVSVCPHVLGEADGPAGQVRGVGHERENRVGRGLDRDRLGVSSHGCLLGPLDLYIRFRHRPAPVCDHEAGSHRLTTGPLDLRADLAYRSYRSRSSGARAFGRHVQQVAVELVAG
jgi:hypothetical protein